MLLLTVIVLLLGVYIYSIRCFDAPVSATIRSALAVCRFVFLLFLLYLLTRPMIEETQEITIAPTLYAALDDTQSMSFPVQSRPTAGETSGVSRWSAMEQVLHKEGILREWINEGFQVKTALFSSLTNPGSPGDPWMSTFPQDVTPTFGYTDIAGVIQAFEQQAPDQESSYLLLFTDGQSNRGKNPLAAAASVLQTTRENTDLIDKRIYTFGIGSTENLLDLIVDTLNMPSFVRKGEPVQIQVHLLGRGGIPAQPIPVRVQGQDADGTLIYDQEQNANLESESQQANLIFDIPDLDEGQYQFTVEVPAIAGEMFLENNRRSRGLTVRSSKDPILVLTSAPDWELKFLKRAFDDQPSLVVDAYLAHENGLSRLGDRVWVERQADISPEVIEIPEIASLADIQATINRWPVIILQNFLFTTENLEFARTLSQYLENGGAVIFIPGTLNTADLPPAVKEALPSVLAAGFAQTQQMLSVPVDDRIRSFVPDISLQSLPPVYPYYRLRGQNLIGQVLLAGSTSTGEFQELIHMHRYGLGRIITLGSNAFWRWRMLVGENIYPRFWLSLLYQSNPRLSNALGDLYTNGYLYEVLTPVQISYSSPADVQSATLSGIPVQVQGPAREETVWLTPSENRQGLYTAAYTPVEPGDYIISDAIHQASTAIRVEANPVETYNIRQNVQMLREIAQRTGGEYANLPAWKTLAQNIPKTTRHVDQSQVLFLGEKWWIAALLVLFLGLEWFIRWRQGLP